jgi:Cys-tRNA(Pro)/Cys-tRNA(Cys) deacylase
MATATRATALLVRNRVTHTIHGYAHHPRADGFGEEAARALGLPEVA